MRTYGIYEVIESYTKEGLWRGYTVAVATAASGKQGWGKLYPKSDGENHYKDKPDTEDLEI